MTAPGSGASSPGSSADAEAVRALIGRDPHAGFRVAVRCPFGAPAVIENDPVDARGYPFPTREWLTCRALVTAVSRLEADGGVRMLEQDPDMAQALAQAHARHQAVHDGHRVAGAGDPDHVKCLHAHLAFALAEGGSPVGDWIMARSGAAWPSTCCLERAA
jgi:hypothetical protein